MVAQTLRLLLGDTLRRLGCRWHVTQPRDGQVAVLEPPRVVAQLLDTSRSDPDAD